MTNEELKALAQRHVDLIDAGDMDAELEARDAFEFAARSDVVLGLIKDNERLTKNYKSLCDSVAHLNDAATSASDEVARLKAECEGLRKDACRYHWLRDKSESVHSFYLSVPIWFSNIKFGKKDVDSSIDAAIQQEVLSND